MKFYWVTATPIHLHTVCGCFHICTADLRRGNEDCVSCKVKNICYVTLCRKSLLTFSFSSDVRTPWASSLPPLTTTRKLDKLKIDDFVKMHQAIEVTGQTATLKSGERPKQGTTVKVISLGTEQVGAVGWCLTNCWWLSVNGWRVEMSRESPFFPGFYLQEPHRVLTWRSEKNPFLSYGEWKRHHLK